MMPLALILSQVFFGTSLCIVSIFLILLVLVQRGRGGGLTGALGGPGGQSAFGTKAGDVFTRITVVTAGIWILLCIATIFVHRERNFPGSATTTTSSNSEGTDNLTPGAGTGGFGTGQGTPDPTTGMTVPLNPAAGMLDRTPATVPSTVPSAVIIPSAVSGTNKDEPAKKVDGEIGEGTIPSTVSGAADPNSTPASPGAPSATDPAK